MSLNRKLRVWRHMSPDVREVGLKLRVWRHVSDAVPVSQVPIPTRHREERARGRWTMTGTSRIADSLAVQATSAGWPPVSLSSSS
jgi:hypothetical protein